MSTGNVENAFAERTVVECFIDLLPQLQADIDAFKAKWGEFYFGSITPFKIFHLSNEDFVYFLEKYPLAKFSFTETELELSIGEQLDPRVYLHTEMDFELFAKHFVSKKTVQ